MSDAVHVILDALAAHGIPVRREGDGYRFPCPAHDGDGFNVKLDRAPNGDALLCCHSRGCDGREIAEAIGLDASALFADATMDARAWSSRAAASLPGAAHRPGSGSRPTRGPVVTAYGREVARWPYFAADGNRIVGYAVRIEPGRAGRAKEVLAYHPDPDGRADWLGPSGRPAELRDTPYNLPGVRAAIDYGDGEVWIVEGEKCADAVIALGLAATTGHGGCKGAWTTPGCSVALAGVRRVLILPDHDEGGRAYADRVAGSLREHYPDADVRVVDLPGLGDREDVVDWLARGGTLAELRRLAAGAELWDDAGAAVHGASLSPISPNTEAETHVAAELDCLRTSKPALDDAAYYGPVGAIVRRIEPHTEAHPAALIAGLLTGLSAAIGRGVRFSPAAGGEQRVNLYALFIGPTSRGAKGTATSVVRQVMAMIDEGFMVSCAGSGLTSGEGLVNRVRDPDPEQDDAGVADARLLLIEEEWGGVLGRSSRDGNSLTAVLREAWDGRPLRTLPRRNPLQATRAHIAVLGNVTAEELLKRSDTVDFVNGFFNRLLVIYTEAPRALPFGGSDWKDAIAPEVAKLTTTLEIAREMRDFELGWTAAAKALWSREYERLRDGEGTGLLAALTARGRAIVLRLAMLYALIDRQRDIAEPHLRAALSLWRYAVDSLRFVFAPMLVSRDVRRALEALTDAGANGIADTEWRSVFGSHNGSEVRRASALDELSARGLVVTRVGRARAGRPTRRTYLTVHDPSPAWADGRDGQEVPAERTPGEVIAQNAQTPNGAVERAADDDDDGWERVA